MHSLLELSMLCVLLSYVYALTVMWQIAQVALPSQTLSLTPVTADDREESSFFEKTVETTSCMLYRFICRHFIDKTCYISTTLQVPGFTG